MKRKTVNKAIVLSTTAAMAAGSTTIGVLADSVTATSVKKDTIKDQTAVNILKPKSGYTYLSSVASAAKQDNIVTVTYENGEKAQIIFLENNLFRFDMEPDGKSDSFKDYATPNNSEETGRIIQQKDDSSVFSWSRYRFRYRSLFLIYMAVWLKTHESVVPTVFGFLYWVR